ncbi:hypothetical protein BJY52DRAFT_1223670 [Lactarius psammicola]|nr:hypothetical protein BJY52DRAFT_1223670 [Lactarius psammicola]
MVDAYHAYYRNWLDQATRGDVLDGVSADADRKAGETGEGKVSGDHEKPPPTEYILEMPNISAVNLYTLHYVFSPQADECIHFSDTMKLIALFTARQGHSFLATLSIKEGRNYRFDFLKPTHSLFGTNVLMHIPETLEKVKIRSEAGAKWKMLAGAQLLAKWERTRRGQEKKREDDRGVERVRTNEFTAADTPAELPPPMSVQEVSNMTLAQKRMAAMAAAEAEAAAVVSSAGGAVAEAADDDMMMEESDDEDAESERKRKEEGKRKEVEHAKAVQASSLEAGAPMKFRTDYVPKWEEERERLKEWDKVVRDGHIATKAGTLDKYSKNVNFDEQIAAIRRAKGLGLQEANAIGPGIGPTAAPPSLTSAPPALPISPTPVDAASKDPSFAVATISSGPQPPSTYPTPAPVMLPPLHYQGLDSAQPFGYQPPPGRAPPPFTPPASAPPVVNATGMFSILPQHTLGADVNQTASDFAAGAAAVEREHARVEDGRHDRDDHGTAAEPVRVDAAGPHHRGDGKHAVTGETDPVVLRQDAHEIATDRELQSGGRPAHFEREGLEEK